jgi:hypothetical protein
MWHVLVVALTALQGRELNKVRFRAGIVLFGRMPLFAEQQVAYLSKQYLSQRIRSSRPRARGLFVSKQGGDAGALIWLALGQIF